MAVRQNRGAAAGAPPALTSAQRDLLRRTVGATLTTEEFEQLVAIADRTGLDPLRRQLSAVVRDPSGPGRSVLFITTIDGLRSLAARDGDYRPMETAPKIVISRRRRDALTNPSGLVRAEVTLWKQSGRRWHAVGGEAWWDEFAPLPSTDARGAGARLPDSWEKMGRLMLAKCAEAQALRRGWPERLSGLYASEEGDRARLASRVTGAEFAPATSRPNVADQGDALDPGTHSPQGAGGAGHGDGALSGAAFWLCMEGGPERVALLDLLDRIEHHLDGLSDVRSVQTFVTSNRTTWGALWLRDECLAFAVKAAIDHRITALGGVARAPSRHEAREGRISEQGDEASSQEGAS